MQVLGVINTATLKNRAIPQLFPLQPYHLWGGRMLVTKSAENRNGIRTWADNAPGWGGILDTLTGVKISAKKM
jgi:hypothetical protein